MSEPLPKKPKPPPAESDLSQVMAHGPALSEAFGPRLGALVLLFGIARTRRGFVGITTAISIAGTVFYNYFLK